MEVTRVTMLKMLSEKERAQRLANEGFLEPVVKHFFPGSQLIRANVSIHRSTPVCVDGSRGNNTLETIPLPSVTQFTMLT